MLKYSETSWKHETGFDIQKYRFTIGTLSPSKVSKEQQTKIDKISLVAFLSENQKKPFIKNMQTPKAEQQAFLSK